MENLWKAYQRNFSYADDLSWHTVMDAVRVLYQTVYAERNGHCNPLVAGVERTALGPRSVEGAAEIETSFCGSVDVGIVLPAVIGASCGAGEHNLQGSGLPRIALRNVELELEGHILEIAEVDEVADRDAGTRGDAHRVALPVSAPEWKLEGFLPSAFLIQIGRTEYEVDIKTTG